MPGCARPAPILAAGPAEVDFGRLGAFWVQAGGVHMPVFEHVDAFRGLAACEIQVLNIAQVYCSFGAFMSLSDDVHMLADSHVDATGPGDIACF